MPLPDEYDSWRCDNCLDKDAPCKAEWQDCDQCDNHITQAGTDCDDCGGAGGGHICIHDDT